LRSSSSGSAAGPAADDEPAQSSVNVFVALPPLLLAAVLRDIVPVAYGGTHLSFERLITDLTANCRKREFDDVGAFTLRLQLVHGILGCPAMQLRELYAPLANTELGPLQLLVPRDGFEPLTIHENVDEKKVSTLLAGVAWPDEYEGTQPGTTPPWAFVFNARNGPGDSMVVLRLRGEPSGELVVIHLQSKLRTSLKPNVASWERIDKEAGKVVRIGSVTSRGGQTAKVQQMLLYVSDEPLPKRRAEGAGQQQTPKRTLATTAGTSVQQPAATPTTRGHELDRLALGLPVTATNGLLVLAVFQDSQWVLRGAVQRIKDLLDKGLKAQTALDKQLLALSLK
jgi:hypothetical protein